jgi:hypothetical protein
MKETKFETTVISPEALSHHEKGLLIAELNIAARRFLLERGLFSPNTVVTLEAQQLPTVLCGKEAA